MSILQYDETGYLGDRNFISYHVNNPFYLQAPPYYYNFYSMYIRQALSLYDGYPSKLAKDSSFVSQKLLQSISRGLTQLVYSDGIDFTGSGEDYSFAVGYSMEHDLVGVLKEAEEKSYAGGTTLFKLNRTDGDIYISQHRMDTFFPSVDGRGKVTYCKIYLSALDGVSKKDDTVHFHYDICEERYFDKNKIPVVVASIYKVSGSIENAVLSRPNSVSSERTKWENLPQYVRQYVNKNFPSIVLDRPLALPFKDSLGCFLLKGTRTLPQMQNCPFGQPIGDILRYESMQYDQLKSFEANEVDLARARALIPEQMWNKDDPDYDNSAMSQRFFQKVSSFGTDDDKITPIQFDLRAGDIRTQKENILRDIGLKLNLSSSTVATFLSEGASAKTATEIENEKTKTATWIKNRISDISHTLNEMFSYICRYYGMKPVRILIKAESQTSYLERLKINSDVFSAGNMSPERFVRDTYCFLTEEEKNIEIQHLKQKMQRQIDRENMLNTAMSAPPNNGEKL